METEHTIYLTEQWPTCPIEWRNFIDDLRSKLANYGYLSNDEINIELERYSAYRDKEEHLLFFKEEKYKNLFILKWRFYTQPAL